MGEEKKDEGWEKKGKKGRVEEGEEGGEGGRTGQEGVGKGKKKKGGHRERQKSACASARGCFGQ